ncbi:MAG: UvrD-helicase domain-containing protein [Candidatus Pacebacteria bacterium]|nr:UvrD-helicase domain-containing protein [Candidatus Paceibacterota bacterium]
MARTFALEGPPAGWRRDLLADLNEEQRAVVTAKGGPMLVVAGAGSGKTRALTYRLAWLVERGADPGRILLMTFTNRAAQDMLRRVGALLHQDIRRIWGGTFHHIGNRLLRLYGTRVGVDPAFTIIDREDSSSLMRSCVMDLGLSHEKRNFPNKNVLVAISSLARNTMSSVENIVDDRYSDFTDKLPDIQRTLEAYTEKKRESQVLDFDDLLGKWLELLEDHSDVRNMLADRFENIMVDEYQDTTAIQGRIVDCLGAKHRNICVVGDDAQAIYSFRGATFANILHFQDRYPDAVLYKLETNYRSTPEILGLANDSIGHNRHRLEKHLRAVKEVGIMPALVPCEDHNQQARFIAEYVRYLLDHGKKPSDIAVLYRSHWHSMEIQLELQRATIPFQVRGGVRFFEQAHVKDLLAYLRIIHNPHDETAWNRVLPHIQGIGERLSQRVWNAICYHDNPLKSAVRDETVNVLPKRLRADFLALAKLLNKLAGMTVPGPILAKILKERYDNYVTVTFENARQRRDDLRGMIEFAEDYDTSETFLGDVTLATEFAGETALGEENADADHAVILSTVHQAKGLEWSVVFIPWLVEGRFPVEWSKNEVDEEEEERRIFHVAVTRGEKELYLLVPRLAHRRNKGIIRLEPSVFVRELSEHVYEPLLIESGGVRRHRDSRGRGRKESGCSCEDSADGELVYDYDA